MYIHTQLNMQTQFLIVTVIVSVETKMGKNENKLTD